MSDIGIMAEAEDREADRAYAVIVNTRRKVVHDRTLTFEQVVALAFPDAHGADVTFTVTYHHGVAPRHEGTLSEGGTVTIKEGTIFDVTRTVRS
jgi:hypothetical protein